MTSNYRFVEQQPPGTMAELPSLTNTKSGSINGWKRRAQRRRSKETKRMEKADEEEVSKVDMDSRNYGESKRPSWINIDCAQEAFWAHSLSDFEEHLTKYSNADEPKAILASFKSNVSSGDFLSDSSSVQQDMEITDDEDERACIDARSRFFDSQEAHGVTAVSKRVYLSNSSSVSETTRRTSMSTRSPRPDGAPKPLVDMLMSDSEGTTASHDDSPHFKGGTRSTGFETTEKSLRHLRGSIDPGLLKKVDRWATSSSPRNVNRWESSSPKSLKSPMCRPRRVASRPEIDLADLQSKAKTTSSPVISSEDLSVFVKAVGVDINDPCYWNAMVDYYENQP